MMLPNGGGSVGAAVSPRRRGSPPPPALWASRRPLCAGATRAARGVPRRRAAARGLVVPPLFRAAAVASVRIKSPNRNRGQFSCRASDLLPQRLFLRDQVAEARTAARYLVVGRGNSRGCAAAPVSFAPDPVGESNPGTCGFGGRCHVAATPTEVNEDEQGPSRTPPSRNAAWSLQAREMVESLALRFGRLWSWM
jgi:hypothetical protein